MSKIHLTRADFKSLCGRANVHLSLFVCGIALGPIGMNIPDPYCKQCIAIRNKKK